MLFFSYLWYYTDTVIVNYGIRHVGTQTLQQYVIMSIVNKAEIFCGSVTIQWIRFLKWISQNIQLMWHLKTPSLQTFCRLNRASPHIKFLVFFWDFFVDEERQSRSISFSMGQTFSRFCVSDSFSLGCIEINFYPLRLIGKQMYYLPGVNINESYGYEIHYVSGIANHTALYSTYYIYLLLLLLFPITLHFFPDTFLSQGLLRK